MNTDLEQVASIARDLVTTGRYGEAVHALGAGLRVHPLAVAERYLLGVMKIAANDHRGGQREIERSLILAPGLTLHWRQLGNFHLRLGRREEAGRFWWRAVRCDPTDNELILDLLRLFPKTSDLPTIRLLILINLVFGSGDINLFRRLVDLATRSEDPRKRFVFGLLKRAMVERPDDPGFYPYFGWDSTSLMSDAERHAFRARFFTFAASDWTISAARAGQADKSRQYDLAERHFRQAILLHPTESTLYKSMYFQSKYRYSHTKSHYFIQKALYAVRPEKCLSDYVKILCFCVAAYRGVGDTSPMIEALRKALFRPDLSKPLRAELLCQLASCQIEFGDRVGSLESLEVLDAGRPQRPTTYLLSDWANYYYKFDDQQIYKKLNNSDFIKFYDIQDLDGDLDVQEFNAALRERVANHPTLELLYRGDRGGYSQTKDHGPGSLLEDQTPELARLRSYFEQALARYRAELPEDDDHAFLKLRNEPVTLSVFWGLVIKDCESSPTHRHGIDTFVTAIYYPNKEADQGDPSNPRAGWLEVLRPELNIPINPEDILEIEPRPGRFIFLPSYFFHRALPMMSQNTRVSIVADFNFSDEQKIGCTR
jgi:tetratricopeptide (TPR) repeat protein